MRFVTLDEKHDDRSPVTDPVTGMQFYELSHPWGMYSPIFPGYEEVKLERITYHAKHGVMTQRVVTIMHVSTHVNAPIHLIPAAAAVGMLELQRFFGTGVVLSIPKGKWESVEPADLEKAAPEILPRDIVIINTGWHKKYSDSQEYFGCAPGLSKAAAEWLVARKISLFAIDTGAVDHPLATSLGLHRNGPLMRRLPKYYRDQSGRDPKIDFPEWNPAHRTLLAAGIPTIENVGGALDEVTGLRCTFHAYPWKFRDGDACIVRLIAILDPSGRYRIASGQ